MSLLLLLRSSGAAAGSTIRPPLLVNASDVNLTLFVHGGEDRTVTITEAGIFLAMIGSADGTFNYATRGFTTLSTDVPANTFFEPRILDPGNFERLIDIDGSSKVGTGDVVIASASSSNEIASNDTTTDSLIDEAFDGYNIEIRWIGSKRDSVDLQSRLMFRGSVDQLSSDDAYTKLQFKLHDKLSDLDRPLLTNTFGGTTTSGATGGLDGNADLKGQKKQKTWGISLGVTPQTADAFNLIYMGGDNSKIFQTSIRDGGVFLALEGDVGGKNDLYFVVPVAGEYVTCLHDGYFRLNALSVSKLTMDMYGDDISPAYIAQRIIHYHFGLFDYPNLLSTYGWTSGGASTSLHADDPSTIGDHMAQYVTENASFSVHALSQGFAKPAAQYYYRMRGWFARGVNNETRNVSLFVSGNSGLFGWGIRVNLHDGTVYDASFVRINGKTEKRGHSAPTSFSLFDYIVEQDSDKPEWWYIDFTVFTDIDTAINAIVYMDPYLYSMPTFITNGVGGVIDTSDLDPGTFDGGYTATYDPTTSPSTVPLCQAQLAYRSSGKYYYEARISADDAGALTGVGLVDNSASISTTTYIGSDVHGWGILVNSPSAWHNGVATPLLSTPRVGDRVGFLADLDTGTLDFVINGVAQGLSFPLTVGSPDRLYCPAASVSGTGSISVTKPIYDPPLNYAYWGPNNDTLYKGNGASQIRMFGTGLSLENETHLFTQLGLTVSYGFGPNVDGFLTAYKIIESSDGHVLHQLSMILTGEITATKRTKKRFRGFLKYNGRGVEVGIWGNTGGQVMIIDMLNGVLDGTVSGGSGGVDLINAEFRAVHNGWYFFQLDVLSDSTITQYAIVQLITNAGAANYVGDGASGVYVDRLRFEDVPICDLKSFAVLDHKNPVYSGILVEGDETCLSAAQRCLRSVGGYVTVTRDGLYAVGRIEEAGQDYTAANTELSAASSLPSSLGDPSS